MACAANAASCWKREDEFILGMTRRNTFARLAAETA
jgi:hypothetical protein